LSNKQVRWFFVAMGSVTPAMVVVAGSGGGAAAMRMAERKKADRVGRSIIVI
jgi:hypothetical protein